MHFRRLEAQGYKSFATKTVFEIEAGITAVVGPNGSGKSNVVDALRWVMGETQTRQLRAKRLEEVIFAGSEARASAGMAEVRLVLDNAEGWLPLEFAEVVVARRTHRSGESEFFINEQRVRLREIQELFSRSGLGSGGYALIGQGLVDEMLRLKPEERRGLIEEVAGVGQQRQKMVESRRRRGAAHEEIDRARLLVEEIEPRLRTLERQAKRARQQAELAGGVARGAAALLRPGMAAAGGGGREAWRGVGGATPGTGAERGAGGGGGGGAGGVERGAARGAGAAGASGSGAAAADGAGAGDRARGGDRAAAGGAAGASGGGAAGGSGGAGGGGADAGGRGGGGGGGVVGAGWGGGAGRAGGGGGGAAGAGGGVAGAAATGAGGRRASRAAAWGGGGGRGAAGAY